MTSSTRGWCADCRRVSTNLTIEELADRYGERITSRFIGDYTPLIFCGKDVRIEKMGR